mmetsp:Transcript_19762/g.54220  ORF Transcript_19762/g.54220 Transcript_19762/m.54220 type:complete len:80 (-) Transcript_19762:14-253(-)
MTSSSRPCQRLHGYAAGWRWLRGVGSDVDAATKREASLLTLGRYTLALASGTVDYGAAAGKQYAGWIAKVASAASLLKV